MDIVNEKATFQHDDIFHRVDFAKKAMTLIESHPTERGACVVSIDAPWGMGKSTFLRMWMNELETYNQDIAQYLEPLFQREPNMCIYYNAWEHDYYDNALVPLLFTMCGSLLIEKEEKEEREEKKLTLLQKVVSAGAGILSYVVCASTTQNPELAAMVSGMASTATESVMQMFRKEDLNTISEDYLKEIEIRDDFRKAVADLAQEAGKLFFFIDELDRCKPLFAIQTLECIKHFFNIPNVVFVFATDISQLAHSIAGVYGSGINAGGYLSKFFDYQMNLPAPNIRDLMKYSYPTISVDNAFYDIANEVRLSIGITPREMPMIVMQANAMWRAYKLNAFYIDMTYCFSFLILLFGIKYRCPDQYYQFLHGTLDWHNVIEIGQFKNIEEMLRVSSKWIDKTPNDLRKEFEQRIQERSDAKRNGESSFSISEEEYKLLMMLDTLCERRYSGTQTVGETIQIALELFDVKMQ